MIYGLLVHTVHKLNNKTIVPIFPPQALKNFYHHAVSIFVVILVELTNTVFVFVFINSTNITTNIETAVLSKLDELCFLNVLRFNG